MATRNGELYACFGVMGGFMQPQGHVQVCLTNHDLKGYRGVDTFRMRERDATGGKLLYPYNVVFCCCFNVCILLACANSCAYALECGIC